jgi:hypothetical protein
LLLLLLLVLLLLLLSIWSRDACTTLLGASMAPEVLICSTGSSTAAATSSLVTNLLTHTE